MRHKPRSRGGSSLTAAAIFTVAGLVVGLSVGQSNQKSPDSGQVPDAPSASRPISSFPTGTPPAPKNPGPSTPLPATTDEAPAPPAPSATVRRTAPGGQARDKNSRNELGSIIVDVNYVFIPVTVKDSNGHLVDGLLQKDFKVLEDGVEQPLHFFTSDPFPLSVAVVVDANLPEGAMKKVNQTLPALAGAFSQFDEVGIFTYGSSVEKKLDFKAADDRLSSDLRRIKPKGRTGAVVVNAGPLAAGPTVNGRPLDPSRPHVTNPSREYYVLNDAILQAATELAKRDRARRKVIFVISDGHEDGSAASYNDVLKVLLSNEISVYAVAVDAGAIPAYDKLGEIKLPRMGYGNILPKYVSATGGEVFAEFTRPAIESAYAKLTEQARNQYTLGYKANNLVAGNYRSIEVLVHRPGVEVRAKGGYYPLPPSRQ